MLETSMDTGAARRRTGADELARIRALLDSAERKGRAPDEVLDDIARLVADRAAHQEIYQKPLG